MATASQEQMQKLHELIATQLLAALEKGGVEIVECECGKTHSVPVINTKDMTNAIKFLKDNSIEVAPGVPSTTGKLGAAMKKLPFPTRAPHEEPVVEETDAPAQPQVKAVGVVLPFART